MSMYSSRQFLSIRRVDSGLGLVVVRFLTIKFGDIDLKIFTSFSIYYIYDILFRERVGPPRYSMLVGIVRYS